MALRMPPFSELRGASRAPRTLAQTSHVAYWHEMDMPKYLGDVRCWVNSGKHMLAWSFSGFDPGCVKTCTSQECAELFSLSSSLSSSRKHFWFSNLRNREGVSTRR